MRDPQNPVFHLKDYGEISGFAAAKVFDDAAELGPLVSKSSETAEKLLNAILCSLCGSYVSLYLPSKEKRLCEMLIGLGFMVDFRLARMFYGAPKNVDAVYVAESLERG